jgi:hypothetical protein
MSFEGIRREGWEMQRIGQWGGGHSRDSGIHEDKERESEWPPSPFLRAFDVSLSIEGSRAPLLPSSSCETYVNVDLRRVALYCSWAEVRL